MSDLKPRALFEEDENGRQTHHQIARITPAKQDDVNYVLAQPTEGHDGRSDWIWVRLKDGTLMLACFPQGDTYLHVSDAGVCDWTWAVRYVVDGHEHSDPDSPLAGDGQYPPFRVFDPQTQDYVGNCTYATRQAAQAVADQLNREITRA